MSLHSSSSNDSHLHHNHSSNNPYIPHYMDFFLVRPHTLIFTTYCITNILLLLPLSILVLYVGLQQRRQQRSNSTTATSHSDVFTYHLVTMELFGVLGHILCCCGVYMDLIYVFYAGLNFWTYVCYGEMFFHLLTCVERYLAVVHPITYLSLRGERGIRIRNISIGCVWLLCCVVIAILHFQKVFPILNLCLVVFSLTLVIFCSLFVLCVLIRPKPGEQGKVDQSKQRAFYTIVAILGVLLVRLVWNLIGVIHMVSHTNLATAFSGSWFNLPCSLVLPLLFLHRAGIPACRTTNTKRGQEI